MQKPETSYDSWQDLPIGLVVIDAQANIISINHRTWEILGMPEPVTLAKGAGHKHPQPPQCLLEIFSRDTLPFSAVKKTGQPVFGLEHQIEKPNGITSILSINSSPLFDNRARFTGMVATLEEITDHRLNEEDRDKLIQELLGQSKQLKELNDALKVLLAQRDRDKEDFEEKIIINLKSLVLPYLERLRNGLLSPEQRVYIDVALANINDLFSAFGSRLSSQSFGLTPRELEIADLVKHGKSNKDIAQTLCISTRSVETHRRSIRRKLGIQGKGVNLRSYLSSLH